MDSARFDTAIRLFGSGMTRREALRGLVAGVAALSATGALLSDEVAAAKKKKKRRRRKRAKNTPATGPMPEPPPPPPPPPPPNPCEGKNWCIDRSQTCGPAGGYGKCLVEASGGNICAQILFQATSCAACGPAKCTNCRCVLAAGGGDRCNNGPTGYDFICVRDV